MTSNIYLVGFMGTGKTTVGKQLALKAKMEFKDLDALIEKTAGESIPEIFEKHGEACFRALESQVLAEVVRSEGIVLATGGGVVLNPANLDIMKSNGIVVCLTAGVDTLWERLKNKTDRPLLNVSSPREALTEIYNKRAGLYDDVHFTVHVDNKEPSVIADEILLLTNYIKLFNKGSVSY